MLSLIKKNGWWVFVVGILVLYTMILFFSGTAEPEVGPVSKGSPVAVVREETFRLKDGTQCYLVELNKYSLRRHAFCNFREYK